MSCEWCGINSGREEMSGFCTLTCREEFFSSLGAGDTRGINAAFTTIEDLKYIKSLPSPA